MRKNFSTDLKTCQTISADTDRSKPINLQKSRLETIYPRAARYSKINIDIVLSYPNIQGNNQYNIYIQFSIQYQDCGVKNFVLSCKNNNIF